MRDAGCGVAGAFVHQIVGAGGRREDFAYPVRSEREVRALGELGHPLAAPAREVRDEDLVVEVEFWFVEDPPSARSAVAFVERGSELADQPGAGACRGARRGWVWSVPPISSATTCAGASSTSWYVAGAASVAVAVLGSLIAVYSLDRSRLYITPWEMSAGPEMLAASGALSPAIGAAAGVWRVRGVYGVRPRTEMIRAPQCPASRFARANGRADHSPHALRARDRRG